MICFIEHRIVYRYSRPVFLAPHRFRVRPRETPYQKIREFAFHSDPLPAGICHSLETSGDYAMRGWFAGETERLETFSSIEMEVRSQNPFDFLPSDGSTGFPVAYEALEKRLLAPFMDESSDEEVRRFALSCSEKAERRPLAFLTALCSEIRQRCSTVFRPEGAPWSARETLSARCGACRDLAILFVESCRSVGLAARFVSGYHLASPSEGERHLHAWAEVYIPGGGWRGFDPTTGLAVAQEHIPLAASATPGGAALVEGCFYGTGVDSTMESRLTIRIEG